MRPKRIGRFAARAPACIAFLLPAAAAAQAGTPPSEIDPLLDSFVHESWTVRDGLPVNSINYLLQTRDGYLWIATFDGLVRFDGVRFTVYNSSASPELPSNRILSLHETSDGALWLRTEQAQLVRFRTGEFTQFGPERGMASGVTVLYEDAGGTLWVGTEGGLGRIDGERFVAVATDSIAGGVAPLLERSDGSLWVATYPAGLVRLAGGTAASFAPNSALAGEEVQALHEDTEGALWIATDQGLWRYDGDSLEPLLRGDRVRGFRPSPRTGELWIAADLGMYRVEAGAPIRVDDGERWAVSAWVMLPDPEGNILYTVESRLYREGRPIYALGPGGASGIDPMLITSAVFDHEGSLWLGTGAGGLHRLKPSLFTVYSEAEGLANRNVYSVYEDRTGGVWIGTFGAGVSRISGGRITSFGPSEGYPSFVRTVLHDRSGRLWLGSELGVHACTLPAMRCVRPAPDPIGMAYVYAIFEDADGALWFGTQRGLFRHGGGHWHRFTEAEGAPSFPVRAFAQTADGALWMGTNGGGISRYDPQAEDGGFVHLTTTDGLPSDLIRSLHEDGDGWLWIGSEGRGLARLDAREFRARQDAGGDADIVVFATTDGLYDGVVHQILEDDFGRIWMSGNRGIFWVPRAELNAFAEGLVPRIHSSAYTERDGLRNREANGGSQPAGMRARDGRLWFPTQDGVAVVDPAQIQQNPMRPNVVIEQVTAGGVALVPGAAALELGVEQRDLEIDYTALSFLAPGNVRFRYRLEPYEDDWVDAGGRRTVYYTRVPPGHYTFRVVASNNDGVWNEEGAALELLLAPRFRETGAFQLLWLLTLGMLLGGGVGWRVRHVRARTRELGRLVDERTRELRVHQQQLAAQNAQLEAQAEQLQEMDRAKSRFFTNISHEFRTPLALIIGPLGDIHDGRLGEVSPEVAVQVSGALHNGRRLLRLTSQLLDLARLEAGALQLTVYRLDLVALLEGLAAAFTPAAERRRLRFERALPSAPLWVYADPARLEMVFANLLSNAFKFTPPGGCVRVSAAVVDERLAVRVEDSGPGIAPAELPRIFERFYQTELGVRQGQGSGVGLALARELTELHGGSIAAESREGVGTVFTVELRPGSAHLAGAPHVAALHDHAPPLESPADAAPPLGAPPLPVERPDGEAADAAEEEVDRPVVLVVDDSDEIRAYVRSHLEGLYRVDEAADGAEALARALQREPDLIVSDVMMPEMDGLALLRAVRENPDLAFVPVILLTARAELEDRLEGLGGGADDYLTKPFEPAELTARIANLIAQRHRLRDRLRQGVAGPHGAAGGVTAPTSAETTTLEARLRAAIDARLSDEEFGVDALAAALHMERTGLYRHMVDELGTTPSDFLREARLARAAALLRDEATTVSEVAYAVGYRSVSSFSRRFRDRFGCSPAAYASNGAEGQRPPGSLASG